MSRPMPGPPEHALDTRDHGGNPDECCWVCYYVHLSDYWAAPPKRLTDAECAAEYWRAASDFRDRLRHGRAGDDLNPEWGRRLIWHRFATRPNALEPTP